MQFSISVSKFLLAFLLIQSLAFPVFIAARAVPAETDPFVIPSGLEGAVNFWKLIFTKYSASQLVLFDPKSFRIYEVVTVGKGKQARSLIRFRKRQIARERGLRPDRIKVQRGVSDQFAAGVRRSGRYLPYMRAIFAERGLPHELTYLPLVESSFRTDARSFVGAVGIWQFMPGTGRRFMRVTRDLDERKDPLEATRAAAALLDANYGALGSWPLAVTAYNHGQGGMTRAVRQVGTTDIVLIIRHYRGRTFKFASKNFYAEFLAAVHVMRNVEHHFPGIEYDTPLRREEITLHKYVPVQALVRQSGLSRAELLAWNLALSQRARWLPKGYRLKVTPENEDLVRIALGRIAEMPWFPHRVRRGESLSRIASRYGTTVYDIQVVNGVSNVHRLRVGRELKIPSVKSRVPRYRNTVRTAQRSKSRSSSWRYHRVRRGESLSVIARRYRVSMARLRRVNRISNVDQIKVGDRLKIRKRRS